MSHLNWLNESKVCPKLIVWVVDDPDLLRTLLCDLANVEAVITNAPHEATRIVCGGDAAKGPEGPVAERVPQGW
jgi:hypothetical protein